jgi:hypothetical protein
LTAALQLCRAGKAVTLIDENDALGGCHRVVRTRLPEASPGAQLPPGLFSEHAPRIYSGAYLNTSSLLDSMGTSFDEQFTPYHFSVSSIGAGGVLSNLSMRELLWLAWAFIAWSDEQTKAVSVADYMTQHAFSDQARNYMNRLCLLTDGAGADHYSLWQFLELANQQALYSLYQPRRPTDQGLFAVWRRELLAAGCTIVQGRVKSVRLTWSNGFEIKLQKTGDTATRPDSLASTAELTAKGSSPMIRVNRGVILAIPPASALPLFQKMHLPNMVALSAWARATQYATYIPVVLHFDQALPASVSQIHGFPDTEWGIAFIVLSDYFEATQGASKGLISTVITLPDAVSTHTALSANQTSTEEALVAEVIRQLRQQLTGLPAPSTAFITPGVTYKSGQWHNPNTSYVAAANTQPWGPATDMPEVYSLGTHNGRSAYSFTSMESAITNALALTNTLEPSSARELLSPWTLKPMLVWVATACLVLLILVVVRW